ncbi:hypothetical protein LPU83_pLPU83c_0541 (plasmid) [Rhizobium favelukesii]|uniref:Uncharacterized protein n=1 Tax=Rhizobium favelukesii TaxID=348824 RepID=W6RQG4_9HYPH|nr:hypothetical protein LPU83_pLPU83c_0541 [Rhizobium favelukesii]
MLRRQSPGIWRSQHMAKNVDHEITTDIPPLCTALRTPTAVLTGESTADLPQPKKPENHPANSAKATAIATSIHTPQPRLGGFPE